MTVSLLATNDHARQIELHLERDREADEAAAAGDVETLRRLIVNNGYRVFPGNPILCTAVRRGRDDKSAASIMRLFVEQRTVVNMPQRTSPNGESTTSTTTMNGRTAATSIRSGEDLDDRDRNGEDNDKKSSSSSSTTSSSTCERRGVEDTSTKMTTIGGGGGSGASVTDLSYNDRKSDDGDQHHHQLIRNLSLVRDETNYTALHWAARNNFVECAQLIIEKGGVDIELRGTRTSVTALHLAANFGYPLR